MPTIIVTPSELRAFARQLEDSAKSITSRKNRASQIVMATQEVFWKGEKYERFSKLFEETISNLDRFARWADDYSQFLNRKANLAQKILDNR